MGHYAELELLALVVAGAHEGVHHTVGDVLHVIDGGGIGLELIGAPPVPLLAEELTDVAPGGLEEDEPAKGVSDAAVLFDVVVGEASLAIAIAVCRRDSLTKELVGDEVVVVDGAAVGLLMGFVGLLDVTEQAVDIGMCECVPPDNVVVELAMLLLLRTCGFRCHTSLPYPYGRAARMNRCLFPYGCGVLAHYLPPAESHE